MEEGVTSFKLFMAYPGVFYSDDGQILRAMQRSADNGGLIMMHAENGIAIDVLVEQALAAGRTDPRYHGEVRKVLLEAEATHRAIQLARVAGAPLYVVHVSAEEAVAELAAARDKGLNVFGETCPQYLFLSTDNLAEPDFEGAKYVCSTPLRPKEHQAALWRGLRTNDLQVVSTDHCPFCFNGQKDLGRGDFSKIPNGLPGVENRMDLLHQAVVDGHITRRRWIEIACATPARMFGLYPKKGTIAPGADADVVIYDPHAEQTLSVETHHMNVDYSAYEGKRITGQVRDRPLARRSRHRPAGVHRPGRPRPVHPARHLSVPELGAPRPWTSDSSCRRTRRHPHVVGLMRRAERNGFRYGWTFDSAVLWQEPFVIYSRILEHTENLIVGPMVTNPGTRTWEVTASTFATLNDMYGNRTVCGIGRGDSAMRVAGRKPNTLARLGEAMGVIRDLAEGREAVRRRPAGTAPVGARTASCRCGWARTGPRPWLSRDRRPTASSSSSPTCTSPSRWSRPYAPPRPTPDGTPTRRHHLRRRARLRRRRPGARPRPVPLVRRHGRQPRRRSGRPLRRALGPGARGAHRVHQGARGVRLQPPRPRRQPVHGLRARTRSSTGSVCWVRPRRTSRS